MSQHLVRDLICWFSLPELMILTGHNKKEKNKLITMIDDLDKKAEIATLSNQELNFEHYLNEH